MIYKYKYIKYKTKYLNLKTYQHGGNSEFINNFIQELLGIIRKSGIKIIAMGEATHGQDTINEYSADIFKALVKNENVTGFVLENQYLDCQLIDNYIKGDDTYSIDDLIKKLMWPWRSVHMIKMINWMKKYNAKHNNILDFKGTNIDFRNYTGEDAMTNFINNLKEKEKEIINTNSANKYFNFSDRAKFDIFMKYYDENKKYFVLMHNGHISKKSPYKDLLNFGNHMSDYFGDKYFVIGNSFNGNSILAVNIKESAKQHFSLEIVDFGGEIDILKLTYYDPINSDYEDDANYKKTESSDLKYKLPNGITWSPKYISNQNVDYSEMFTIECGSSFDPDDIYRTFQLFRIDDIFDVVIQLENDSYLKLA